MTVIASIDNHTAICGEIISTARISGNCVKVVFRHYERLCDGSIRESSLGPITSIMTEDEFRRFQEEKQK